MLLKKGIPLAYILGTIKYDIVFSVVVAASALFITAEYGNLFPEVPLNFSAFLGTAISILLSFKLSQSYDRWWEARKIWGSIVNDSRSLIIQLQTLTAKGNEAAIKTIAYRQIAWCYALGKALRGLSPLENLDGLLTPADVEALKSHSNKPLALLQLHGLDIKDLREANQLDLFSQVHLDNTLVRLCDAQGRSERIKSTIFPATYQLFLRFMIYLFVIILSFSMSGFGYMEIVLLLFISTPFFLLEKSATHMQNPFENRPTDTAMTAIARNIEINIRQMLKETETPQPIIGETFYLN